MSKRILVISQRVPYPPNKGEKIRTYHQLKCLMNKGFDVDVSCSLEDTQDQQHLKELGTKINGNTQGFLHKEPKWLRLFKGLVSAKSLSEANFFNKQLQEWLVQHVAEHRYCAVLFTASSLYPYALALQKNNATHSSTPPAILIDFMDVDSDKWQQYANQSQWPMRVLYKREAHLVRQLEKKCVDIADKVFLIAKAEIAVFNKTVTRSQNVVELGNGIDAHVFTPNAGEDKQQAVGNNVLFTGVMDYKPNIDAVIWFTKEIWPTVLSRFPDATFTIAGMNPAETVKKLAEHPSIEVTGFVDDIMPYFHKASAFVAPFQIARGVQNKVLQAMSCGLPVITTPMGAEGILCENEENVLVARHADEFAAALINTLSSSALAEQLSLSARKTILEHYSWESKMAPFFNALTENRHQQ